MGGGDNYSDSGGYSGLSRSSNQVSLINFPTITPFCKTDIVDKSSDRNLPYLIIDNSIKVIDDSETFLDENEFKSIIVQLYKFFKRLFESKNLDIISVTHNNYQEVYQITDGTNISKVNVYYDKKGEVKYQNPTGKSAELNKTISDILLNYEGIQDFDNLDLGWRANCYKLLNDKISEYGYYIHWINSTNYKDIIKIANDKSFVGVEFNYDGDGLFSKINIITSSDEDIKNIVITALNSLKV